MIPSEVAKSLREPLAHDPAGYLKRKPYAGVTPPDLWQTCFAVPGACKPDRLPCSDCPVARKCMVEAEIIAREAGKRTH